VILHFRPLSYVASMTFRSALLLALTALPAAAQSQDDLVTAKIRPGWRTADGTHIAALHLQLAPQWKTYWRAPGDAGLPPSFDWSGSDNLAGVTLRWPSPQVFRFGDLHTIGYRDELVLPLEIKAIDPDAPMRLEAVIDIGICNEICMPASLRLSAELPQDGAPDQVIAAALGALPLSAEVAGLTRIGCAVERIDDGLRVTATLSMPQSGGVAETVVMEPGEAGVWVSDAVVQRSGNDLVATADLVPGSGKPFDLDAKALRLTVLTEGHAVEITGCPVN
jgi:DsbC/DsbD-like thiol-disulfide interchange protein